MKIIDTFSQIPALFENGCFSMDRWKSYADSIHPDLAKLCTDDMNEVLATGEFNWEEHFLPVLNAVSQNVALCNFAHESFQAAVAGLEEKILQRFGRTPDVEIILYLGLCSGAGWVTELGGKTVVLLGLEKIVELNWCSIESMYGLIYHELGHVYQAQFGVLERDLPEGRPSFLWQLFTEGIAMVFEQEIAGDPDSYHQYDDDWKTWCGAHLDRIKRDFTADLPAMTFANQRWFGDWVQYEGRGDVGYYLGCRFVRFILEKYAFDDILSFEIGQVDALYQQFIG